MKAAIVFAATALLLVVAFFIAAAHLGQQPPARPDFTCVPGQHIYVGDAGDDADARDICDDLTVLLPAAEAACPANLHAELEASWRDLSVVLEPGPFACGREKPCDGIQQGTWLTISTLNRAALADEFGHEVWTICFARTGESPAAIYDADFEAWCSPLRARMR